MVPGLQHHDVVAFDHVNEAMFAVDPSRPATLEDMAQRLRLADTGDGITQRVLDEPGLIRFTIFLSTGLPVEIVGTSRVA